MIAVGLKILKNRLAEYLRMAARGGSILVTSRHARVTVAAVAGCEPAPRVRALDADPWQGPGALPRRRRAHPPEPRRVPGTHARRARSRARTVPGTRANARRPAPCLHRVPALTAGECGAGGV